VVVTTFRWRDGVVLDRSMSPAACAYIWSLAGFLREYRMAKHRVINTCLFPSVVRFATGAAAKDGKDPLVSVDFATPAYAAFPTADLGTTWLAGIAICNSGGMVASK